MRNILYRSKPRRTGTDIWSERDTANFLRSIGIADDSQPIGELSFVNTGNRLDGFVFEVFENDSPDILLIRPYDIDVYAVLEDMQNRIFEVESDIEEIDGTTWRIRDIMLSYDFIILEKWIGAIPEIESEPEEEYRGVEIVYSDEEQQSDEEPEEDRDDIVRIEDEYLHKYKFEVVEVTSDMLILQPLDDNAYSDLEDYDIGSSFTFDTKLYDIVDNDWVLGEVNEDEGYIMFESNN